MKKDIHPDDYRWVVFQDDSADFAFLTRSTVATRAEIEWEDGNTYPLAKVELSSASHPFYTGKQRIVDTAGRVERFNRRFGRSSSATAEGSSSATAEGSSSATAEGSSSATAEGSSSATAEGSSSS